MACRHADVAEHRTGGQALTTLRQLASGTLALGAAGTASAAPAPQQQPGDKPPVEAGIMQLRVEPGRPVRADQSLPHLIVR